MGSKQSTVIGLPAISKEQWKEIPLPIQARWRIAHGRYRLMENTLTCERIEQYALAFEGEREYQQYLESFAWREREENVVGVRYIDRKMESSLCSSNIRAWVYLPHIPHRLSSITDIPLPENLYVVGAALAGFQKLFDLIGGFWPSEDMVGIDVDGRVRVWLNADYSKNYLYGPHYIDPHPNDHSEEGMVRQVISLVEKNTTYPHEDMLRFSEFVGGEAKGKQTFAGAQKLIGVYAKHLGISVPKYFVSLLGMQSRMSEGSQHYTSGPVSDDPFRVTQSRIHREKSNLIHYIDPALDISHADSSTHTHARPNQRSQTRTKTGKEGQGQGDTTGETLVIKASFQNSQNSKVHSQSFRERTHLPKINFHYGGNKQDNPFITPNQSHRSSTYSPALTPHFVLPLSLIAQNKVLESGPNSKRMTFSDQNQEHYLDEELVEDMARYLN